MIGVWGIEDIGVEALESGGQRDGFLGHGGQEDSGLGYEDWMVWCREGRASGAMRNGG